MKVNLKYILVSIAVLIGIFLLWYFKTIVFFIFVSAILSLVTRPMFILFRGERKGKPNRKISLNKTWSALATVLSVWLVILGFGSYVIPFVVEEIQFLSQVDFNLIIDRLDKVANPFIAPFQNSIIGKVGLPMVKEQVNDFLVSIFDIQKIQNMLSSVADFLGSTFMALFSISFITFFLLKDEWILLESIKLVVPKSYYVGVDHMLWLD